VEQVRFEQYGFLPFKAAAAAALEKEKGKRNRYRNTIRGAVLRFK
jgi:hypothetical protein